MLLIIFFLYAPNVFSTPLPRLNVEPPPIFCQRGLPLRHVEVTERDRATWKRHRSFLECVADLIEEPYNGIDSVEQGFQLLDGVGHSDFDFRAALRECKQWNQQYKNSSHKIAATKDELNALRARLSSPLKRVWDQAFVPLLQRQQLRCVYDGILSAFLGFGFGFQLGVGHQKVQTPLGRRFSMMRGLTPLCEGTGIGVIAGGASSDVGHVRVADDDLFGVRVMPGLGVQEAVFEAGRGYASVFSPAFGVGFWGRDVCVAGAHGVRVRRRGEFSQFARSLGL